MHTYIFFRLDTIKDGGEVEANAHCCVGWDVMTVCCSLHNPERNTKTILQSIFWSSSVRWCIYTVTDGHILGLGGACAAMQPWIRKKTNSSFCFSGPAQSGHATERREPLRLEFPTNYSPSHSCKESCVSYFDTWSNIHMNWGQKEHILYMHAKRERLRCVCVVTFCPQFLAVCPSQAEDSVCLHGHGSPWNQAINFWKSTFAWW